MEHTHRVNVPGRVIAFYEGGGAWADYQAAIRRGEDPIKPTRDLAADELALFQAVDAGRRVRPSKGGFYVIARLNAAAIEAARYWANTLATASADDAGWEPDAANDLRAARKLLARLPNA
jgi:hypothetical protein